MQLRGSSCYFPAFPQVLAQVVDNLEALARSSRYITMLNDDRVSMEDKLKNMPDLHLYALACQARWKKVMLMVPRGSNGWDWPKHGLPAENIGLQSRGRSGFHA